jgi:hypothetical protein
VFIIRLVALGFLTCGNPKSLTLKNGDKRRGE